MTTHRNLCVDHADADEVFIDDEDEIFRFNSEIDYGLLLVQAGVFASVRDAWLKGFKGRVPIGWRNFQANDFNVCLYNPAFTEWPDCGVPLHDDLPWYCGGS